MWIFGGREGVMRVFAAVFSSLRLLARRSARSALILAAWQSHNGRLERAIVKK